MKLTLTHLNYWRERKANPSWQSQIPKSKMLFAQDLGQQAVSVHACINAHAGKPLYNLASDGVQLLKLARHNGRLIECLRSAGSGVGSAQHPRRAARYRKWLARLEKEGKA